MLPARFMLLTCLVGEPIGPEPGVKTMTFKKIVYPVGFEEDGSDPAFGMATKLARESRGTLYLIHVLPLPTPMTFPAEGVLLADRDRAEAMLQKLAMKVPVGVERKLIIKFGHTAPEIAKAALAARAEAIVMGTHKRTGLSRLLLGCVGRVAYRIHSLREVLPRLASAQVVHSEGVDDAGAYGIDADIVPGEFERHRTAERVGPRLRRCVRGGVRGRKLTRNR